MDYIFYTFPNGKVWNYWGEEPQSQIEEVIASDIAKAVGLSSAFEKVRIGATDEAGRPVSFSIGPVVIKRVPSYQISRFNGWFDEQVGDDLKKEDFLQSFLNGQLF
jgi:hypothetical protein